MKVLHVLGSILPSGAETMLASAADVFARQGISSFALSTGPEVGSFAPELAAKGYGIKHIPFRKSPAFFREYYDYLQEAKFDIVHIHTEQAFFYLVLASRAAGVRGIVRTVHHIFPWTGWLRWRSLLQRQVCSKLMGARFISNSRSGQSNEKRRYGMYNDLIPNWYDSSKFVARTRLQYEEARRELGIRDGVFAALSLGGNSSYKNYHLIIKAMARLPKDLDIIYLQVGNEGAGRPLSQLVAQLGLENKIKCCGRVDDSLTYLHGADVFLMPSSIEGFGVAAAEAMACGLPAILAKRPALQDFASASGDICWTECSPEAIADAISKTLSEDEDARWKRGQSLAEVMPGYCGLDVGPVQFAKLYKRLVDAS